MKTIYCMILSYMKCLEEANPYVDNRLVTATGSEQKGIESDYLSVQEFWVVEKMV